MRTDRLYLLVGLCFLTTMLGILSGYPAPTYKCKTGPDACLPDVCCPVLYEGLDPNFCFVTVAQDSPRCVDSTNLQDKCKQSAVPFSCRGDEYFFVKGQAWCDPTGKVPVGQASCPINQCVLP
jgi:hypothetical protein